MGGLLGGPKGMLAPLSNYWGGLAPLPPPPLSTPMDIVSKYNVGLKTLLLEGLSKPEFYGNLVYKFRKIIGKNYFPYHFKKIIVRYKRIGYNIDVLRQTACNQGEQLCLPL